MLAFLASSSTASQPVRTTGLNAITLTCCWMNERIAEIWFSCFPLASENFRLMPAAGADSWMFFVLAVRQPLSAPTWEKPRVILPSADPPGAGPLPQPTIVVAISAPSATAMVLFTATPHVLVVEVGRCGPGRQRTLPHLRV